MNENIMQYEELETEHGIFTSNIELQLSAQQVYDKWLYELENPPIQPPTLEEVVKEQSDKISILEAENSKLKEVNKEQDVLTMDQELRLSVIEFAQGSPVQS